MQSITFYDELSDMEFVAGDTLPVFNISVDVEDGTSLEDCAMKLIVSKCTDASSPIISKTCTVDNEDNTMYHVQLTTEETVQLTEGTYTLFFILIDTDEMEYKKTVCSLYVHSAPKGAV